MSSGLAIRPSQFIFNYGVGSIIEAPNGPRIIQDFNRWGKMFQSPNASLELEKFEIRDKNLSALLNGGRIFSLPTNADLQEKDDVILYRTRRFPNWALCQEHRILYKLSSLGRSRCPQCSPNKEAQDEAIRFVRACPIGHLDDVDWKRIVHERNSSCDGELFDWIERGSTLSDIIIKCKKCGSEVTLRDIYYGTYFCSGRLPEKDERESCNERASVILRNASNLRISDLESALTIPPRDTPLVRILENPHLKSMIALALNQSWDKFQFINSLKSVMNSISSLNVLSLAEIEKTPENELFKTMDDILRLEKVDSALSNIDIRRLELDALKHASLHGHPPEPISQTSDFEVDKNSVRKFNLTENIELRITPVKRLRVVIAQRGYRRPVQGTTHRIVETYFQTGRDKWFIGIALRGEGIFIDLPPTKYLDLQEFEVYKSWRRKFESSKNLLFHPIFVWWHTLSHRLVKGLAIDSGYSSASIRERIYVDYDTETNQTHGGLLLYTSQRGGDGTLGGLISLVPDFDRVLSTSLRNIHSCSNDPLCSEQIVTNVKNNGAACYACLFTSETSCECGNFYLDRNLLRSNL